MLDSVVAAVGYLGVQEAILVLVVEAEPVAPVEMAHQVVLAG
jgi:hypothetical protein